MLLVAVLFLTGGLGYTLVCRYIGTGVENVGVSFRKVYRLLHSKNYHKLTSYFMIYHIVLPPIKSSLSGDYCFQHVLPTNKMYILGFPIDLGVTYEPRSEKIGLRGFQPWCYI